MKLDFSIGTSRRNLIAGVSRPPTRTRAASPTDGALPAASLKFRYRRAGRFGPTGVFDCAADFAKLSPPITLPPEKRTPQLRLKIYSSRTSAEQERRIESPSAVHGGVQAGGLEAGQGWAGSVGDGARVGGAQADLELPGAVGRKSALHGAGQRPVSAEQIDLSRLRAEHARKKRERDLVKKATAQIAGEALSTTLEFSSSGRCGRSAHGSKARGKLQEDVCLRHRQQLQLARG